MPTFTGTEGNDTHTGTAEADIINGLGGNDILNGGDGNDEIDGGSGQDQTNGDGGNDILIVSATPVSGEIYNGGADTDTLRVLTTAGTLGTSPSGPSYLVSLSVASVTSIERLEFGSVEGAGLTVVLTQAQSSGLTELVGGAGNDSLVMFVSVAGNYTIQSFTYTNWTNADEAFEVSDVVTLTGSGNGDFTLNAAAGHLGYQALTGANGNDTLNGTDGMEILNGGGGINMLNASGGDDILVAQNFTPFGGVYTNRDFAGNDFNGGEGFDWLSVGGFVDFYGNLSSIEGINFMAAFSVENGSTQDYAQIIVETAQFDILPATLNLRGIGTLSLLLDEGESLDASQWVHLEGSEVEVDFYGTDGSETIVGTAGNNRFSGGFGSDTFTGGEGGDIFEAGEGFHTVTDFTVGQDRIDVRDLNFTSFQQALDHMTEIDGNVVIFRTYNGVAQTLTLVGVTMAELTNLSFIFQMGDDDDTRIGTALDDELIGAFGADHLEGLGGNDVLFGGDNNDDLDGGAENDLLYGGSGNDTILGGAGSDQLYGGDGIDTLAGGADGDSYFIDGSDIVEEGDDPGIDYVMVSESYTLTANVENLIQGGSASINATGNNLANHIAGTSGNNVLSGLGGDDIISGNGGDDTIYGGDGNDRLSPGAGNDSVDGGAGDDVIISNTGTDTLTGGSGNDVFQDLAGNLSGDIITDFSSGDRIVLGDANLATFTFSLSGNTLTYSGGTLTLQGVTGTLVASAAAEGGVQLTLQTTANDVAYDFNGDGRSDILWRSDSGQVSDWLANANGLGGFTANDANALASVPISWHVVGTGDFNGDGKDDLLWRNNNGQLSDWLASALGNGGFVNNDANAFTTVSTSWAVVGVGDFNGDGKDDILWRNGTTGQMSDWLANASGNGGFTPNDANALTTVATSWVIAGVGDFNGDGKDDLLWRNTTTGQLSNWLANASGNGGFTANDANAFNSVPLSWTVVGIGDFNGDNRDDLLWRNATTGQISNWLANASGNGGFTANDANAFSNAPLNWHIAAVGDYNGDNRDDILWRSDSGQLSNWLANASGNGGFAANDANALTSAPTNWFTQALDTLVV